jgi:hypothetical protein
MAQTRTHIARLEVDGKPYLNSYEVCFESESIWFSAERFPEGFIVPSWANNDEYLTVQFILGKNHLIFPHIHKSKFEGTWIVGLEHKRFSDAFSSPSARKDLESVRYIRFVDEEPETQLVIKTLRPE